MTSVKVVLDKPFIKDLVFGELIVGDIFQDDKGSIFVKVSENNKGLNASWISSTGECIFGSHCAIEQKRKVVRVFDELEVSLK